MGYWTERDLPFYYGLARTFPLADHWFSSCLGPTFPNRRFLIAGTAHGLIDDSPCNLLDYPAAGTVFDLLTEHGISWANYHPVASEQPRWRHYANVESCTGAYTGAEGAGACAEPPLAGAAVVVSKQP